MEMDVNKDGKLSVEEIRSGYASLGLSVSVDSIMALCDTDSSGFIDYSEFLIATLNWKSVLSTSTIEAAFSAFDKDHSGSIDSQDLKEVLRSTEYSSLDETICSDLLREADVDGDGEIDLKEFKRMLLRLENKSASMKELIKV